MRRLLHIALLTAALGLSAGPATAANAIEVTGERIELGDLSPSLPRDVLHLDVAPSPSPGEKTTISRAAVRSALARAGADPRLADGLPAMQTVARPARVLAKEDLKAEIEALIADELPVGVYVSGIVGLEEVKLPMGAHETDVRLGKLRKSTAATVTIRVDGRSYSSFRATINLDGQPMTPVLRRNMPKKAVIGRDDVVMAPAELDKLPRDPALRKRSLVGRKLIQPTRAGKPIQQSAVKIPPVVTRGRQVHVVAIARGISISQTATAEEDGAVGDWIRVRPSGSGRSIKALITAPGTVEIQLGATR